MAQGPGRAVGADRRGTTEHRGWTPEQSSSDEPRSPDALARLYADRIASAVLVCDPRGVIVDCNLAASEITGMARDELVGRSVADLTWLLPVAPFFEDGRSAGFGAALEALALGRSVPPMVVGARRDGLGDPVWLLVAARPLPDEGGAPAGAVVTITDITPQKGTETLYATVIDELHGVLHALPDLYFRLDAEGLVVDYNVGSGFDAIATSDDFIGRRPDEFLPAEVGGTMRATIAAARLSREVQTFEMTVETAAGKAFYEGRYVALPDGGGVMIVRDITEQRRAQDELARSEALYRSFFERASVGIFVYDTALRVTDCNEAMLAMTGRSHETFLALDLRERPFSATLRAALDGRESYYEGPNGRPGDEAAVVTLHAQPVLDGSGAVVGGVAVLARVARGDASPGSPRP